MAKKDYSSSNRRKFLIGAGSVAAGGSALFGTAATTTFNLNNRSVGANVVADSDGALKLTDGESQGDIINEVDGKLEIDFAAGGGGGVNVGSVVEVGDPVDPTADPAFVVTNQTTGEIEIDFEFVASPNYEVNTDGSELTFVFRDDDGSTQRTMVVNESSVPNSGDTETASFGSGRELAAGGTIEVAIKVDADGDNSSTDEDLSGVLNITATQGSVVV